MKIIIEWVYEKNRATTTFRSREMSPGEALHIAEDLEKTGRVKKLTFIDQYDSTWLAKELKKYLKEMETEPQHVVVYFDGGYDLQSRLAGLGCVIYFEQNGQKYRVRKNIAADGLASNNEAEYAAFQLSLVELELLDVHHQTVRFIGDSQVVINQLNGEWPVYEKELALFADRIDEKLNKMGIIPAYELIPRKSNQEADRLASQALQGIEIASKMELTE